MTFHKNIFKYIFLNEDFYILIKTKICFQGCNWQLTDWGRVMHICIGSLAIIGSDNGLSPGRHQAII